MYNLFWAFFFFFCLPHAALALVSLNEIAWMGTGVSSSDEWIELYNDSEERILLSGWRIEAADASPMILLSGEMLPKGYFLIERTDDATVPNISADLVASFGKGLANSGETLFLKDRDGNVVDTVVGGEKWRDIGGNNTTKETAQRVSGAKTWATALATPRAENVLQNPTPPVVQHIIATQPSSKKETASAPSRLSKIKEEPNTFPVVNATSAASVVLWERQSAAHSFLSAFAEYPSRLMFWLFVFAEIFLLAAAGFIIVKTQKQESEAESYEIVEDFIEGIEEDT